MKKLPVIVGSIFIVIGLVMSVVGVRHTLSGEPIPGTRYSKASTGPETLLFAVIGVGFGVYLIRRR